MSTTDPKVLVLATFVAVGLGFGAGYWIGSQSGAAEQPARAGGEAPHPVGAEEYVQLGMSALSAGRFQEAERRFRQALEQVPDDPNLRANLAVALIYQRRWDDAEEQIQAAKEANPEMPEVYFLEGIVLRDARGDTAGAKEAWGRFLERVPADSPQAETVRTWLAELDGEAPPAEGGGQTGAESPGGTS